MPLLPGPMIARNTLSRRINEPGYKTVRAQIAACLLCLLIVGALLDGLPDPPAVKLQGSLNNLVSQLHSHVPLSAKNHASDCPTSAPHYPTCFRLGRFSRVEDPPTILPSCIKRQMPLLPVFPKADSPAYEVPNRPILF